MTKKTFILFFGVLLMGLPTQANNDVQKTVYGLIERITPGYASQYELELIEQTEGKDVYEIEGNGRKIILRGNNAVSLASAFNWYLKYTCNAHVSWFGNQLNLPDILPQPADKQRIVIEPKYRVYLNYCTVSYTAAVMCPYSSAEVYHGKSAAASSNNATVLSTVSSKVIRGN